MVSRTSNSDGYVTLAVLLMVGLLAAIVSSLLAVSRPALGLARIGGSEVAAEALLQGGFTTAAFLLLGTGEEAADVNGRELHMQTGNVRLTVSDEGGRIDVNSADPTFLAGLFSAVGGTSMSGQAFANRIADWRDEDEDVNEDGAEAPAYQDAGLPYGPANHFFRSVDEVGLILELSPRDFDLVKPYLTVFTGVGKVDPFSAPEMVLRAIPGASASEVRRVIQARGRTRSRSLLLEALPAIAEYFLDRSKQVYRVRVDVELTGGFSDAAEAVIIAPQNSSAYYQTVAWSRVTSGARQRDLR